MKKENNIRQRMADKLGAEMYAAGSFDDENYVPMNHRRLKRMINIYDSTTWNFAETENRLWRAFDMSRDYRKEQRKLKARK